DLPGASLSAWCKELASRYRMLPEVIVHGIAKRHGSIAPSLLGNAKSAADLGEHFGNGLTSAEIDYCVREEWARTAGDVLWRRTKCGLGMPASARERVAAYVAKALSGSGVPQPA